MKNSFGYLLYSPSLSTASLASSLCKPTECVHLYAVWYTQALYVSSIILTLPVVVVLWFAVVFFTVFMTV